MQSPPSVTLPHPGTKGKKEIKTFQKTRTFIFYHFHPVFYLVVNSLFVMIKKRRIVL